MRERVFEINKEVRIETFPKPGKGLLWEQVSREVEYHGGDGIMVIPLRVDLGTWTHNIAKETLKQLDLSCWLGCLSSSA